MGAYMALDGGALCFIDRGINPKLWLIFSFSSVQELLKVSPCLQFWSLGEGSDNS